MRGFKSPLLARIEVPRFMSTLAPELVVGFEVMGTRSVQTGTHVVEATLVDNQSGRSTLEQ